MHVHTATHVGVQVPSCLEKTHTCTHTQTRTYAQCICTPVCTPVHTDISHVHRPCQLQVHMFSCRSTYLNVCTCPCTNMYAHRHTALYIHVCTQVQACLHTQTHLHTTAHPHIYRHKTACVHTDGTRVTYTHVVLHTGLHSRTCTCTYIYTGMSFAHSVHTVTQVPHCQCSAIMNSQADPWFPAPSGWLRLPSPQPHDRQLGSCQPQCLPLASHPPGVPRSLINPLTNWPPAP